MKRISTAASYHLLVAFSALLLASCGGGSGGNSNQSAAPTVTTISVTVASSSVAVNATDQFTATAKDASGNTIPGISFTWTSSAIGVATIVASTGVATGVATGTTTITASAGGVTSAPITLTVTAALQSIAITPASPVVVAGSPQQFMATGTYSDGSTADLTTTVVWTSATVGVATISTSGLANAVGAGSTVIQATLGTISANTTLTVNPALAISAVSNTSPAALTPLYVSTQGLDITQPAQVTVSGPSGYTATLTPLRIRSDGTVVVATPLFIDPASGNTASATVSLTITQGSQTSAPIALSIQDLPQLVDYGTTLGQITHAFLVFQCLQLAENLNEVESLQLSANTSVDISGLVSSLSARLNASVLALAEVDRVISDNTVVVPAGTLADGTIAQFDQTSLLFMDRVLGLYLTEVVAPVPLAASAASRRSVKLQQRARLSASAAALSSLLAEIQLGANAPKIVTGIQKAAASCTTPGSTAQGCIADVAASLGDGLDAVKDMLKEASHGSTYCSRAVGGLAAVFSTLGTTGKIFGDLTAFAVGAATGDVSTMNSAIATMNSLDPLEVYNAGLALLAAPAFAQIAAANGGLAVGSAVVGLVTKIYDDFKSGVEKTDRDAALNLALAAQQQATQRRLLGSLGGSVQPGSNPTGPLPTVMGIGLQPFGSSGSPVTALADPSWSFQMYAPLNANATNYSNLVVGAYDLTTGAVIGSNVVDLSGLTATTPITLAPIIQGITAPTACTIAQQNAWNQACLNTYNTQVQYCNTLPTLTEQLQCVNAALAAYEQCYGSCVP